MSQALKVRGRVETHLATSTLHLQRRAGSACRAARREHLTSREAGKTRRQARARAHPARCSASSAFVSDTQFSSQELRAQAAGRGRQMTLGAPRQH